MRECRKNTNNAICMIVLSLYPNDPRVRREAEALERKGICVDVICLRGPGEIKIERFGHVTVYRILQAGNKENLFGYLWLSVKFTIMAFWMLQSLSLKNKYKLLQVHNMPDYLVFVGLFHKVAGIPIVLDLHDLMVELFESKWNRWQAQILGPVVRIAEKLSCRFANQLITTSDGFRQRLIERGVPPEKIILVMNSADNNIFKKSKREFPKLQHGVKLLYHGTVASRYGLHIAIEAVWELQKKIPETTLYIFGKYDPSYRAYLEKKIECLGLRDRVHLGGYLSLEEIREVIVHSDIGIVPYLSDSFMNLALSTKTFEYVAMGVPVIASRLPSLTAIFSENCIMYFEPGDANDFVNRLLALCADPEMRRLYVERASLAYESIAWPVMEKRYLNLIQGLMRKRDAG